MGWIKRIIANIKRKIAHKKRMKALKKSDPFLYK